MHPIQSPHGAAVAGSWRDRLRHSTAGRWFVAVTLIAVPFLAANILTKAFLDDPGLRDINNLIKTLVLVGAYALYVRWWEQRPVRELSTSGAFSEMLAGLLLGGLLFSAVVAVLSALGTYTVHSIGTLGDLGLVVSDMLARIAAGAFIEEVVFRLLLLQLLERSMGSAWALVVSSIAFGLAHLGNEGATPWVSILLGVELGLLFGAAYLLTRRLWLCASLHLGWNFAQGPLFSIPVSGQTGASWLQADLSGPAWLTGGAFGAEGSVVAVGVCLAGTVLLLILAKKRERRSTLRGGRR